MLGVDVEVDVAGSKRVMLEAAAEVVEDEATVLLPAGTVLLAATLLVLLLAGADGVAEPPGWSKATRVTLMQVLFGSTSGGDRG